MHPGQILAEYCSRASLSYKKKGSIPIYIFYKTKPATRNATVTQRSPIIPRTNGKKNDLAVWFSKILFQKMWQRAKVLGLCEQDNPNSAGLS